MRLRAIREAVTAGRAKARRTEAASLRRCLDGVIRRAENAEAACIEARAEARRFERLWQDEVVSALNVVEWKPDVSGNCVRVTMNLSRDALLQSDPTVLHEAVARHLLGRMLDYRRKATVIGDGP